ncbi:hypothetical protein C8Q79DRAFT_165044 [Trametes meyenii]|nr:hypothetical protein C8Q79DRAFT_165044 [Trametes meyenii]
MKATLSFAVLLAATANSSALKTPNLRIRQGANDTANTICSGATVVSASAVPIGSVTLEITKFSCAPVAPSVQADTSGFSGLLGGFLGWLFPSQPDPQARSSTVTVRTTTTRVSTTTATAIRSTTATRVSTSIATSTQVSTVTAVSTETATATETDIETATETATATETDTATEVQTETATETEVETRATTVVQSVTNIATVTAVATVTVSGSAAAPTSTAINVCGEICTTVCAQSGRVPPSNDDCATLVDSITVLESQLPPTFDVAPNHVQTITFGTYRFFFENVGLTTLEYCWLDLAQVASASGNACFPPVQPTMSEGLCIPRDANWEAGVAHS